MLRCMVVTRQNRAIYRPTSQNLHGPLKAVGYTGRLEFQGWRCSVSLGFIGLGPILMVPVLTKFQVAYRPIYCNFETFRWL